MGMFEYLRSGHRFLFLLGGLYLTSLPLALGYQRLLKQPFKNILTGNQDYFESVLFITFSTHLIAALVAKFILLAAGQNNNLPWRDCIGCGLVINVGSFGYNKAIIYSSFPAVVMAKSCSLLSVVLVGVACSRVRDRSLKLGWEKIGVALLACTGLLCFNHDAQENDQGQNLVQNQANSTFPIGKLFLLISLMGDGFLPDFQAKIKDDHKPSAIQLCYSVNIWTAVVAFTLLLATTEIIDAVSWLYYHQQACVLLLGISVLNALTQLFVYQMLKEYRQHVPAFAVATRKCITVLLSFFWYHHELEWLQSLGVALVFISIFLEVYTNYLNSLKITQKGSAMPIKQEEQLESDQIIQNRLTFPSEQGKD